MTFIALLMTIAMFVASILGCISDVRALRIPNILSLIVLGCFPIAFFCMPAAFDTLTSHVGAMVLMFVITYAMFFFHIMGGGDSKLGTSLGLWVGMKGLFPFVFYMSIMGGVIGVATIIIRKKKPFKNPRPGSWIDLAQKGENAVPYGLAIVFGASMSMLHTSFVHNILNEVTKIIH